MPVDAPDTCGRESPAVRRARRRMRGFRIHLAIFAGLAVAAVVTTLIVDPESPWIVLPLVGWGPMLALHVAWVMGLFDGLLSTGSASDERKGERR